MFIIWLIDIKELLKKPFKLILYPLLTNNSRNLIGSVLWSSRYEGVNSKTIKGIWYFVIKSKPPSMAFPSPPSISIFINATFLFDKKGIKFLSFVTVILPFLKRSFFIFILSIVLLHNAIPFPILFLLE